MSQAVSPHRWTARRAAPSWGSPSCSGWSALVVLVDALRLDAPTTDSDRVGPQAFPLAVAVLLLVCAVALALDVLRGGHGGRRGG